MFPRRFRDRALLVCLALSASHCTDEPSTPPADASDALFIPLYDNGYVYSDGAPAPPDAGFVHATRWSSAVPLTEINTSANESHGTMTADQLLLCFSSNRAGGRGGFDVYCARRPDSSQPFNRPANEVAMNTTANEWMPAVSADGAELYFVSDSAGGAGGTDLYRAVWSSAVRSFTNAIPVGELNTAANENNPAVSADNKTIYFDSDRPGGRGGSDLYIATRAGRMEAFASTRLLGNLDTAASETNPGPSGDSTVMVFCYGSGSIVTGLRVTERVASGWTMPAAVFVPDSPSSSACGPSILVDGSLLFHGNGIGGRGGDDLYVAPPSN